METIPVQLHGKRRIPPRGVVLQRTSTRLQRLQLKQPERAWSFSLCRVYGQNTYGIDCGDEAGRWISKFIGRENMRLLFFDSSITQRLASGSYLGEVGAKVPDSAQVRHTHTHTHTHSLTHSLLVSLAVWQFRPSQNTRAVLLRASSQ